MIAYSACNEPKFVTTNHLSTKKFTPEVGTSDAPYDLLHVVVMRASNDSICFAAIVIAYLGRRWSRTGLQQ